MPDTRWGASPEEWLAFSNHLGLAADLLPVVSNPAAHISAGSTLAALGKVPSRYNRDGDATGIAKWTAQHSTKSQIAAWQRESDYGICLQTRRVRAIDIDIGEADVVEEVLELVDLALGPLPRRYRRDSAKCLLLIDLPMAEPLPKRVLRLGERGAIEFLADGQQCIVAGTHPKGERYQWVGGVPEVVPRGTLGELDVLWQALEDRFAVRGELVRVGAAPSEVRTAAAIDDPAVAWLGEHWHVKSLAADGRMAVACPWEAEHTEGTGSETATTYFPAGVGGFDRGNFKCLHAHCAGRTVAEFFAAVGYDDTVGEMEVIEDAAPVLPVADPFADRQWPAFERRKDGGIEATMHNTVRAVARPDICGARVAFDRFKDGVMIAWRGDTGWRPLKDNDYTALRVELEKRGFVKIGKEMVRDAVLSVADTEQFDSAQQWAESLEHDGRPRVDTFLTDFYSVPDSPYARAVSAYIWTALAGRALVPGIKADMVPVFISGQGTGKTTSVECLAPEESSFVEIDLDKRETDTARMMRGKLVGEIAELKGLVGKEAEAVRAWVTKRTEAWIPKYVEFECTYKRRLLMIGTGNNPEFLDDDTGERRWLPVTVGAVDVEGIRAVRDQLWAEGVARFKANGIAWQDAQDLARHEHGAHKVSDVWDPIIADWLERDHIGGTEGEPRSASAVRMFDVMVSALGFQAPHIRRLDETRAGKCMRRLGYEKRDQRVGSRVVKAWFKAPKV